MRASQRIPEIVNWYALEDRDDDAGDGKTDDKVVAPDKKATELDDTEDAILEENAAIRYLSDKSTLEPELESASLVRVERIGLAHT